MPHVDVRVALPEEEGSITLAWTGLGDGQIRKDDPFVGRLRPL